MPLIIPTAEPFFFPGNATGCLLVHGFTGTPKEMRWMGEYLAEQGFSVLGIRLAGHATTLENMGRTRWQDWLASVEDGWNLLQGFTDRIFLAGLSMGGVLSLFFATQQPVAGVIAMSTPIKLPDDPRLPYLRWLSRLVPTVQKGPPDWRDSEASRDHVHYPVYPSRSIAELNELLAELRATLPKVTAPVLLIHSTNDGGIDPAHSQAIFDQLGSQDKRLILLDNSGHVITREPERLRVYQEAASFIRRVSEESQ